MTTLMLATAFLVMVAAPCWVAWQNSRSTDRSDELDIPEPVPASRAAAQTIRSGPARVKTVQEILSAAETEAASAHEVARDAHWAALAASARVATLRANAASEAARQAGRAADKAVRAAEAEFNSGYLPETHPSLDFPRSRVRHRAA